MVVKDEDRDAGNKCTVLNSDREASMRLLKIVGIFLSDWGWQLFVGNYEGGLVYGKLILSRTFGKQIT